MSIYNIILNINSQLFKILLIIFSLDFKIVNLNQKFSLDFIFLFSH